jgi:hypothetical protein
VLESIGQDATAAMVAGKIDARTDSHVSHTPLLLDEQGWGEITSLLADTLNRAIEIQEGAAGRLAESKSDPVPTTLAILHFEKPAAKAK